MNAHHPASPAHRPSATHDASTGGSASANAAATTAAARVVIVVGSANDLPQVQPASDVLTQLGVAHELRVLSAHRAPEKVAELAKSARERGVRVLIGCAGAAAHLAGALAAHSSLPVIGLPLAVPPLNGLESLLATVQMPSGVPVATVAIGGAENAALLAAQILGTSDDALAARLDARKRELQRKVEERDAGVRGLRGV
jgi:5-(carboxyamino)imidazole ribonucleotide mutase